MKSIRCIELRYLLRLALYLDSDSISVDYLCEMILLASGVLHILRNVADSYTSRLRHSVTFNYAKIHELSEVGRVAAAGYLNELQSFLLLLYHHN